LDDQHLAGAVMWVPGGLLYAVPAVVLFVCWLQAGPERGSVFPVTT
jgi:cytochrome c oxidase assembly factor CtaG